MFFPVVYTVAMLDVLMNLNYSYHYYYTTTPRRIATTATTATGML